MSFLPILFDLNGIEVLWYDQDHLSWALSLESNVQKAKIVARCAQDRQHVWDLNRVWDIWDDSTNEFVPLISLRVNPHSNCPIGNFIRTMNTHMN